MTDPVTPFALSGADPLGVLESTLPVVRGAKAVRIVPDAIGRFAASPRSAALPEPLEDTLHCRWLPPRRFCFAER